MLSMVFKLLQTAQKKWIKLRGFRLISLVSDDVKFKDGDRLLNQILGVLPNATYTRFDNNSNTATTTIINMSKARCVDTAYALSCKHRLLQQISLPTWSLLRRYIISKLNVSHKISLL